MKKQHLVKLSLAAAAVVGALAGGNAMADVTVFGIADAGIANVKSPGGTATTNFVSGAMSTSAFGIKGSEDLGSGMKADFALSSFIDLSSGKYLGNLFTRESWVGIGSSELGHVSLGRDVNPSFVPTILFNAYGDSGYYGPLWHATYFDPTLSTFSNSANNLYDDTAWDSQIRYTTPSIGGAVADINYATDGSKSNFGGNVMYFNGPIGLSAYYMSTSVASSGGVGSTFMGTTTKPSTAYFVAGSYDFGIAKVFASYQDAQNKGVSADAKTYSVSAAVPFGAGKVLVEYADTKYADSSSSAKYSQTAVGYVYPLSKKMDLYGNYLHTKQDSDTGYAVGGGVRLMF